MIYQKLLFKARQNPTDIYVIDNNTRYSFSEILDKVDTISKTLSTFEEDIFYLYFSDSLDLLVCLFALDSIGKKACILNKGENLEILEKVFLKVGKGLVTSDESKNYFKNQINYQSLIDKSKISVKMNTNPNKLTNKGEIIILTTGTTGVPKAAKYNWEKLLSQMKVKEDDRENWLLIYPLNHFAGIQIFLHTLVNNHILVIPPSRSYDEILSTIINYQVHSISATPTFWRMFTGRMISNQISNSTVKQITLGGEAITQDVLERLKICFPIARVSQVFATTELGSCFSVNDLLPGFPSSYLERKVGNVEIRIIENELFIKSSKSMDGYLGNDNVTKVDDEWISTGDIVEIDGDRVYFRGRKSEIINVGGVKVHPLKIEAILSDIPGIRALRILGQDNPISGKIVCVEVEPEEVADKQEIISQINIISKNQLNRYERPRIINFVESIPKQNHKIVRK